MALVQNVGTFSSQQIIHAGTNAGMAERQLFDARMHSTRRSAAEMRGRRARAACLQLTQFACARSSFRNEVLWASLYCICSRPKVCEATGTGMIGEAWVVLAQCVDVLRSSAWAVWRAPDSLRAPRRRLVQLGIQSKTPRADFPAHSVRHCAVHFGSRKY